MRRLLSLILVAACPCAAQTLTITEVMYAPSDPGERLEYVEIYNMSRSPLDISGYRLLDGVAYAFPEGTWIEPYSYAVVARDPEAFKAAYGSDPFGPFEGELANAGEVVTLSTDGSRFADEGTMIVRGPPLSSVPYNDRGAWPNGCVNTGHSISLLSVELNTEEPASWAHSPKLGGTPGKANGFEISFDDTILIPQGATWRFKRGTEEASEPIDAWRQIDFVDDAWESGSAGFGFADNDDTTILGDMMQAGENPGYLAVFIRKKFTVDDVSTIDRLTLWMLYDDGFVAYVNGREVARNYLVGDPPTYLSVARSHEATRPEPFDISAAIPHLRAGENVLCVQGHNQSLSSNDFSLHPWLIAAREVRPVDVASGIVFNECLYRTNGERWVELYNSSKGAISLAGYHLSRDPRGQTTFPIPAGASLEPRGFYAVAEAQLGFSLEPEQAGGGNEEILTLFLFNSDRSAVVAARTFDEDVVAGSSAARYPDGGETWYESSTPTRGAPNAVAVERGVVINEIMYHPFHAPNPYTPNAEDGRSEREYLELLNISDRPIDLSGWYFSQGITFIVPEGVIIGPGEYLVIARRPDITNQIYGLGGRVLGPYTGVLADAGELVRLRDRWGNIADQVRYYDGGRWPRWADGGGSSLELKDPRQDNSQGLSWEASDERAKAQWTEVAFSGKHPSGGESELAFLLTQRGEMLLDDVQVSETTPDGPNMIGNPGFESGLTPWRAWQGTHEKSAVVAGDAHSGQNALLVAASGRGDNWYNNIELDLTNPRLSGNKVYHVKYWAKWQRGNNWFFIRSHRAALTYPDPANNLSLARCIMIPVPERLGTPGAPNSVAVENLGPVIGSLRQDPAAPTPNQEIRITCAVSDADGVQAAAIKYKTDLVATVLSADMFDDGMHGDGMAGDGVYGGAIPGQANDARIAFWISATDTRGAEGLWPRDGQAGPAAFHVFQNQAVTELPTYRIVQLKADRDYLWNRRRMANSLAPASFVFNEKTIYHNAAIRFRGSPWIRPGTPDAGYRVRFPQDNQLNGTIYELNLDRQHPDGGQAMLRDRTAAYLMRRVGRVADRSIVPYSIQQYVRIWHFTQSGAGTIFEQVKPIDRKYLGLWFGDDDAGTLFKSDDWFESSGDGDPSMVATAEFLYRGENREHYRWFFKLRSNENFDAYEELIDFTKWISSTSAAAMPRAVPGRIDVDEWFAILSIRFYIGDWDTMGFDRGKNAYFYLPTRDRRWRIFPWDSDLTFQSGYTGSTLIVNAGTFPAMAKMLNTNAGQRRINNFYHALINGPAAIPFITNWLNRTYSTFDREPTKPPGPASLISFMTTRNNNVKGRLGNVAFRIRTPAESPFVRRGIDQNVIEKIEGDAPASVAKITVNGEDIESQLDWKSTTRWSWPVEITEGTHTFAFAGLDAAGKELGRAEQIIVYSRSPEPTIESIDPAEGPDEGGTEVTIRGTNLQDGARVLFGDIASAKVTFVDAARLTAIAPPAAVRGTATVDVKVINPDMGEATLAAAFTYKPLWPAVQYVQPDRGDFKGGTTCQIFGERFVEGSRVFFAGTECPQVTFVSGVELAVTTPPGPGGVAEVRVQNPDGRSSACSECFTYEMPQPVISAINPDHGSVQGMTPVEILGQNFQTTGSPIVVIFGGTTATVWEASETRILAESPAAAGPGSVAVMVTDAGGRFVIAPFEFTYTLDGGSFVRGDANRDGRLTVSDLRVILKGVFGGTAMPCADAGDANDDGTIDTADAIYLAQFMFVGGPQPPLPYPQAGPDPTGDVLACDG